MWHRWLDIEADFQIRWIGHGWLVRMGSRWSVAYVPYDNHIDSVACAWPTRLPEEASTPSGQIP